MTARRRLLVFAAFLGLIGAYYAAASLPWFENQLFPAYLQANARASAWMLSILGEQASAREFLVLTPRYALEIRRGCDAVEPAALFAAAVLVFPAAGLASKAAGLAAGVLILMVLNLLRIVSLYYVGVHWPAAFETVHIEIWQPLFIAAALLLWVTWALWARSRTSMGGPARG